MTYRSIWTENLRVDLWLMGRTERALHRDQVLNWRCCKSERLLEIHALDALLTMLLITCLQIKSWLAACTR